MKKFFTLIIFGLLQGATFAQTQNPVAGAGNSKSSVMVYSQDEDALVTKAPSQHNEEILIESLPYFETLSIPVFLSENAKGPCTFKKHPSLLLPEHYSVIIEDKLTGGRFDLKSSDTYSFEAYQNMPERFVLLIDKQKTTLTAMR
jgi:hypothetical protein